MGTNVNLDDWVPYMLLIQKMYIRKILGDALLAELQTQVKAATEAAPDDPNPISQHNRALLIEIAPTIAFYTIYQGLPFQWAKIQNKGLTTEESENSKAVDHNTMAKLQRKTLEDAERCAHDLIDYLCKCAANYPLWAPYKGYGCVDRGFTCCDGSEPRYGKPYDSGVYFPRRRGRCRY